VRRRGLGLTLDCSGRCTVRVDLIVSRNTRRRYGLPSQRIGRATVELPRGGGRFLRVDLTRKAKSRLRRARSLRVQVRATQLLVSPAIVKSGTVRVSR
jgi:hypothetical protein